MLIVIDNDGNMIAHAENSQDELRLIMLVKKVEIADKEPKYKKRFKEKIQMCPVCGVKKQRLGRHMVNQHPDHPQTEMILAKSKKENGEIL